MNNLLFRPMFFSFLLMTSLSHAQKVRKYNLGELFKEGKLIYCPAQHVNVIDAVNGRGVTAKGIVLLKNVTFSTGSIDVDIRGKDVLQQSFVGIAFHAIDTITYEAIYFRPFNFQSTDSLRKKHMVEYISEPEYPWYRLRKEHPLVYENTVTPSLRPTDWFHIRIVVAENEITVYVNHSPVASLKVKKLSNRNNGFVGLWTDALGLNGDFANLEITKKQ
jgi:hypothetical protein